MPEATRITAIRHGETTWNAEGRLQGQIDVPLNARGRRQAERLAPALADAGLDRIYASDLQRAWETATALAGPLRLPLVAEPALRERHFGVFQGRTVAELEQDCPEGLARWHSRWPDFAPEGAESLRSFSERVLAAVHRLARAHPGQHLALVCHGGVLDCLYRAATGQALDAPRTWRLANASIHRMLHTGEGFTLIGWNDTRHLDDLALDELG